MKFQYVNSDDSYQIIVDGYIIEKSGNSSSVSENIHAIQGFNNNYEIEYNDGTLNDVFDIKPSFIDTLIEEWQVEKNRIEKEELEASMSLDEKLESGVISLDEYEVLKQEYLIEWRNTTVVSKFQAKAALYQSGMLETVQTHMETADPMAQMAWEDAQEFRRYSPTMKALAVELGMTEEQLDDLFRLAATIEA